MVRRYEVRLCPACTYESGHDDGCPNDVEAVQIPIAVCLTCQAIIPRHRADAHYESAHGGVSFNAGAIELVGAVEVHR